MIWNISKNQFVVNFKLDNAWDIWMSNKKTLVHITLRYIFMNKNNDAVWNKSTICITFSSSWMVFKKEKIDREIFENILAALAKYFG